MSLTKAKLADHLVSTMGFDKLTSIQFVDEFFKTMSQSLVQGKAVKLPGFGNFECRQKPSRWVRNPKTKKPIWMNERCVVVFKAGKKLKMMVRQSDREFGA